MRSRPDQDRAGPSSRSVRRWVQRGLFFAAVVSVLMGLMYWISGHETAANDEVATVDGRSLNTRLLSLPANRWVRIAPKRPGWVEMLPSAVRNMLPLPSQDWTRQGHAGIAFDSKRDSLLIFGSNTHGTNWDNSVHEFSPLSLTWTTHYPASRKESYRADGTPATAAAIPGPCIPSTTSSTHRRLMPWW